ncbi:hypothetical protein CL617_04460 [archaeon]|nr:hypothetical protein [archaeon]|tara:strand:+ start:249 stop:569 length:321 start_codon:yes stop_codon:yes gene_type:complete
MIKLDIERIIEEADPEKPIKLSWNTYVIKHGNSYETCTMDNTHLRISFFDKRGQEKNYISQRFETIITKTRTVIEYFSVKRKLNQFDLTVETPNEIGHNFLYPKTF